MYKTSFTIRMIINELLLYYCTQIGVVGVNLKVGVANFPVKFLTVVDNTIIIFLTMAILRYHILTDVILHRA